MPVFVEKVSHSGRQQKVIIVLVFIVMFVKKLVDLTVAVLLLSLE